MERGRGHGRDAREQREAAGGDAVDAEKKTPAEKAAEAARRRAADAAEREMAALADEAIENAGARAGRGRRGRR